MLPLLFAVELVAQAIVILLCIILIVVALPIIANAEGNTQRNGWITLGVGAAGLAGAIYWTQHPFLGANLIGSIGRMFHRGRGEDEQTVSGGDEYSGDTVVGADDECCGGDEFDQAVSMDNDPVLGADEDLFGEGHFNEMYTGGGEDDMLDRINELVEIIDHGDNKAESLVALQGKIEDLRRDSVTNSGSVLNVLDEALNRGDQLAAGVQGLSEADRQKIDDVLAELCTLAKDAGKSSEATLERIEKLKEKLTNKPTEAAATETATGGRGSHRRSNE